MIAASADQVYVHECAFEHDTRYSTQDIRLGVRLTQINLLCMALTAVVQHPRAAPSGGYARASYASGGGGASRMPRIAGDVTAGPALVSRVLVSYAPCAERRRL
jgi:hypothetical protein